MRNAKSGYGINHSFTFLPYNAPMRLFTPHSSSRRNPSRLHGFSLIELSVVVAILSVVATFGLEGAVSFINRTNGQVTKERMAIVDQALRSYFRVYGRLPCPALLATAPATSTYGLEDCSITAVTAASVPAGSNVGGGILYGSIPFRNLNLPMAIATDGWSNRIMYAVTKNLTVAGTSTNSFADSTNSKGGIEVRTGILEQPCSSSKCQVVADPTSTTGAAYVIFSTGSNQRGGYSAQGTARAACAAASSNDKLKVDTQNCINTDGSTVAISGGSPSNTSVTSAIPRNVFYDGRFNNGLSNLYYFDDYIIWRPRAQL